MSHKPREWTLTSGTVRSSNKNCPIVVANGPLPGDTERVTVIEKSAYDKLEKELQERCLQWLTSEGQYREQIQRLYDENKLLRADLDAAVKALTQIEAKGVYCCDDEGLGLECEPVLIAKDALASIKARRD